MPLATLLPPELDGLDQLDVDSAYAEWKRTLQEAPGDALRLVALGRRVFELTADGHAPRRWRDEPHLKPYFDAWFRRTFAITRTARD